MINSWNDVHVSKMSLPDMLKDIADNFQKLEFVLATEIEEVNHKLFVWTNPYKYDHEQVTNLMIEMIKKHGYFAVEVRQLFYGF